ncbi:MAG: TlpA disulfide reductase family protein [Pseudomonadota bacterium]
MTSLKKTIANAVLSAALLALLSACDTPQDPLENPGQWTFVNYWAQWCKPCIKEIPELNELHAEDGYQVLGVNFDGAKGEDLEAQLSKLNVQFPTLPADPAARLGVERPQVLPTTVIIDPDGEVLQVLIGPQTRETLIAAIGAEAAETTAKSSTD